MSRFGGQRYYRAPAPPSGGGGGGSLVQQSAKFIKNNTASYTEVNVLSAAPTVGNDLILFLAHYKGGAGATTGVTLGGAAATLDKTLAISGSYDLEIWRARAVSTSRDVAMAWASGATHGVALAMIEVTPLAASPVDKQNTATATGTAALTVTNASPNAQANELVCAFFSINASGTMGVSSPASTGYTSAFVEQNGSANSSAEASFKIVTSIETSSAGWTRTLTGTSGGMILTYKF